jgi:DNA-binding GntR family transcriptional regulator
VPKLKYEQIADFLRQQIADGVYGPGDLIPSSRDLCEQFAVSRATAVKALDTLRNDGLVVARQGSGFAVTETPLARPAGYRMTGTTRVTGAPYRRLGTPAPTRPPALVADALGLPDGTSALRRDRLILADDGSPYSFVAAWFPPDVYDACPRLTMDGPIAEGTTRYIARTINRSPVRGRDLKMARLATQAEAELLELEVPAAVVVVLHVAYDGQDRALVCEEGVTPAALWEDEVNYPMTTEP